MIYSLNFGDGTSDLRWGGQKLEVWVGSYLGGTSPKLSLHQRLGERRELTPEQIRDLIGEGKFVRVLRPAKSGGTVPRVVHSVTEKQGS